MPTSAGPSTTGEGLPVPPSRRPPGRRARDHTRALRRVSRGGEPRGVRALLITGALMPRQFGSWLPAGQEQLLPLRRAALSTRVERERPPRLHRDDRSTERADRGAERAQVLSKLTRVPRRLTSADFRLAVTSGVSAPRASGPRVNASRRRSQLARTPVSGCDRRWRPSPESPSEPACRTPRR